MVDEIAEALEETGFWRSRNVVYWAGKWNQLAGLIPSFEIADFRESQQTPSNPYMKSVVRLPRTKFEQRVPVGVVSNTYTLVQHTDVVQECLKGIRSAGIDASELRMELGLTELGEWMHMRIIFPENYDFMPRDGKVVKLRLEGFNSVDGSSRLIILLSWLRIVCTNGMVIPETKAEFREIHDRRMDIEQIPHIVGRGLKMVHLDLIRLRKWNAVGVEPQRIKDWANNDVTKAWGKKAACRVFHVCTSGYDVELTDPFSQGDATDKPVQKTQKVPGAPELAHTFYDVSQALSWVASNRKNAEERLDWQTKIPDLVESLAVAA